MLSNSKSNELSILSLLIRKNETLQSISEELNIPKRTVKEHIHSLNQQIEETINTPSFIQSDFKGSVFLNPEYSANGLFIFYKLKLQFLKETLSFQILLALITEPEVSQEHLIKKLFITKSYLSRLVVKINDYLSPLKLRVQSRKGCLEFAGEELVIRIFSFVFLTGAFQAQDWPFSTLDKQEMLARFPFNSHPKDTRKSGMKQEFLYQLLGILTIRFKKEKPLPLPKNEAVVALMKFLQDNYNIIPDSVEDFSSESERLHFNFMSRILTSDIISDGQKLLMGKKLLYSDLDYAKLAKKLLQQLSSKLDGGFSRRNTYYFIYFLTLYFGFFSYLGIRADALDEVRLSVTEPVNQLQSRIQKISQETLEAFIKENQLTFMDSTEAVKVVTNLITMFAEAENLKYLYIYIQTTNDLSAKIVIKTVITSVFNAEKLRFTEDVNQADLLIVDTFEAGTEDAEIFFFEESQSNEQWHSLIQTVQHCFMKKLLQE